MIEVIRLTKFSSSFSSASNEKGKLRGELRRKKESRTCVNDFSTHPSCFHRIWFDDHLTSEKLRANVAFFSVVERRKNGVSYAVPSDYFQKDLSINEILLNFAQGSNETEGFYKWAFVNRKLNYMDNDGRWIYVDNTILGITRGSLSLGRLPRGCLRRWIV